MTNKPPGRRSVRNKAAQFVAAGGILLALGGFIAWRAIPRSHPRQHASASSLGPTSVPACAWPLHVVGTMSREHAGLIRCYLRALATHNYRGMDAVTNFWTRGPIRVVAEDFTHSADARAGVATARLVRSSLSVTPIDVRITFADGVHEDLFMDTANPGSWHSWRFDIGALVPAPPGCKQNPCMEAGPGV